MSISPHNMAEKLTDELRAALIDKKRHPAEELTPFTPDELKALAQDFAKRGGSQDPVPYPEVANKIDFSGVQFSEFFASGFSVRCCSFFSVSHYATAFG
jgi:hypothetical protein